MHEVGLAQETLDLAVSTATRQQASEIRCLRIEVGQLSGVVVDALRFALETLAAGTMAAAARMEIEEVVARAYCGACEQSFDAVVQAYRCPRCGECCPDLIQGRELRLVSVEVG